MIQGSVAQSEVSKLANDEAAICSADCRALALLRLCRHRPTGRCEGALIATPGAIQSQGFT